MNGLASELRYLLKPWLLCVLLPAPLLLFEHSPAGRGYALMAFFLGCMIVVAYSFRRDVQDSPPAPARLERESHQVWHERMKALALALFAGSMIFTVLCVLFNNPRNYGTPAGEEDQGIWLRLLVFETPRDFAAPILAVLTIFPSLGVVPYFVLITKKPFAAVIFSGLLEGCMKFLGAIVVVLVYGWDASEKGHTGMPWNNPDLLVWLFLGFSAALSLIFYFLGMRKFTGMRARPALS